MFEKEIKFVSDFSLNRIKNLGSFFTFEKLSSVDIHPAIIRYISAELDFLIYEDRRKLLQQSVFDYSGEEIGKLFIRINEQIKKNKRISFEDIKRLIIQAVSFNINFVARPKWSLTRLVYDNADNKPVDEIKLMLDYLYYYDYLKDILITFLNKRKMVTVSLIEFELILNKIDKEIFAPSQAKALLDNAIYSIAEFFNVGGLSSAKVSPVPIEIFLKEKNLIDYLFRLRRALPQPAKGTFEVEELRNVIYSSVPLEQQAILKETPGPEPEPAQSHDEKIISDLYKQVLEQDEEEPAFPQIPVEKAKADDEEEEAIEQGEVPEIEEIDEVPEEAELKDDELIIDIPGEEDLLKMYDEELKEFEKDAGEIVTDTDEIKFEVTQKEHLEDLYEFKEPEAEEPEEVEPGIEESAQEEEFEFNVGEEPDTEYDPGLSDEKTDDVMTESFRKFEIPGEEPDFEIVHEEELPEQISPEESLTDITQSEDYRSDKADEEPPEPKFVTVPEEKKTPPPPREFKKNLFSYLSNKEIDKIIDRVFNEDSEDFTTTVERISDCNTYEEATEILKSVFLTYRVNPYSRDAVTLTNAVSNYFNQV
jgi:hypothetical protein